MLGTSCGSVCSNRPASGAVSARLQCDGHPRSTQTARDRQPRSPRHRARSHGDAPRALGRQHLDRRLHKRAGWDQSIPEDAVTIYQIRADGVSYLQPTMWSRFGAGQTFTLPAPQINVTVTALSSAPTTATVRLWDTPEGSLRKEDSKPKVYLIQGGRKRWVTSPAVLFALRRSWADVRSIPDGGLAGVPDGPDVSLLTATVTPLPVPVNRAAQTTFTATDTSTGNPVAGRVLADGVDVGPTNASFSHTFRSRRVRIPVRHRSNGRSSIPPSSSAPRAIPTQRWIAVSRICDPGTTRGLKGLSGDRRSGQHTERFARLNVRVSTAEPRHDRFDG